jgi:spore coat protein A
VPACGRFTLNLIPAPVGAPAGADMNTLARCRHAAIPLLVLLALSVSAADAQLLDATAHPKFGNALPIPARIDAMNAGNNPKFNAEMAEVQQWLGLYDGNGQPLMTTVWGYGVRYRNLQWGPSYPGPTFEAYRDVPIRVHWKNNLPAQYDFPNGATPHLLPVDRNLHIAHPNQGGVPTVAHLHGGHTESASDGLPEAWFTQDFMEKGPYWVKPIYQYDNDQEAATLWYHDHALGITRLNVYAGLAGFYLLRDDNETALTDSGVIPGVPYEIEVVVQDRYFTEDGQLFFPAFPGDPAWDDFIGDNPLVTPPSVLAEFFGDFILVNGVAWPKLDVEPRKYRFRLLNGSDSRFYIFELDGLSFLQIGTDNGLLPMPVEVDRLLLAPGERADVVVDFAGLSGSQVTMRNFGPDEPFKGFNEDGTISDGAGGVVPPADPATTGQIMRFDVSLPLDANVPDATVGAGTNLRPSLPVLQQTGATRQVVLFEGMDEFGRLQPLLGTMDRGSQVWVDEITETPMLNDTEVWEIYNATEDAHPIHLHLVSFQVLDRQEFTGEVIEIPITQHNGSMGVGGKLLESTIDFGPGRDVESNEQGWKDTIIAYPGQVTRVIATFDRVGRYVWHCHILSHEDHEMMRPYEVLAPAAQLAGPVTATEPEPLPVDLHDNAVSFTLVDPVPVDVRIFDVQGREVRHLADAPFAAGSHRVAWDERDGSGQRVAAGVYFYRISAGSQVATRKTVIVR